MTNAERNAAQARLLLRWRNGDETAREALVRDLDGLVHKAIEEFFLPGAVVDDDDLHQEAWVGVLRALKYWQPGGQPLGAAVWRAARGGVVSALKASQRIKRGGGDLALSLDADATGEGTALHDRLPGGSTPARQIVDRESLAELVEFAERELTEVERCSLFSFDFAGRGARRGGMAAVADALGVGTKSVDNARQRGKAKVRRYLDERAAA